MATQRRARSIAPATAEAVLAKAVRRSAEFLGINQATLADVLGVSAATASRLCAGAYELSPQRRREWEFATLFVRLYRSLDALVGHGEAARQWLQGPNLAFNDEKPIHLIRNAEGLVRVLHYLDATRGRI
ncbi:MAG: antitoxin Xre/MbcA/ParS toxin-binding domain-containing protein [Steroidobacteraceae bacterium]